MTRAPAPRPCVSCPYRRDVPSGVWAPEEYEKLASLDDPGHFGSFLCHQQDGRLCAGWVATVDADESIGLRLLAASGDLSPDEYEATLDYETDVPLFASGAEAAAHGLRDVPAPDVPAIRLIERIERKRRSSR